jgi:RNA polymerase subunit RPABC4/transcription elongation factor Spt4
MIMAYTCKNCGAVADAHGNLCNPCGVDQFTELILKLHF